MTEEWALVWFIAGMVVGAIACVVASWDTENKREMLASSSRDEAERKLRRAHEIMDEANVKLDRANQRYDEINARMEDSGG